MRRLLEAQPDAFVAGARDDILRVLELAVLSPHEAVVAPLCAVAGRLFTAFPISRPNPDMPAPAQAVLQKTHELLTHHLHHSANPAARRPPRLPGLAVLLAVFVASRPVSCRRSSQTGPSCGPISSVLEEAAHEPALPLKRCSSD